jgi:hypothetical protein
MSGDTTSNSSFPSCDLALLTMAHQAMLIVPALISGGSYQARRKELRTSSAFSVMRSAVNP